MVDQGGTSGAEGAPGFSKSFKAFLASLSSAFHTLIELFATELEEERERLRQTLLLILLVFFGLSFGLILLTIFIVVLFWERGWITAIGCLAGLYIGVAVIAALKLRSTLLTRPGLFTATLTELGKDRDRLRASARE